MAKAKIYLDFKRFLGNETFKVKRVEGTLLHVPGDILTRDDVRSLIYQKANLTVVIDEAKKK